MWPGYIKAIADAETRTVAPVISAALETSRVLKATSGMHFSTYVRIDSTAPSATYYVLMMQAASLPSNGAVTLLHAPQKVIHTTLTSSFVTFDDVGAPAAFTDGLVVAISTTEFSLTLSGAYLVIDGSVL